MPLKYQKYIQKDFSGGITDYYRTAQPNQFYRLDNFTITLNKGIETRPGSEIFDSTYPQVPSVSRINNFMDFNDTLYAQSIKNLYHYNSTSGWGEILGPSPDTNSFFGVGTADNFSAYAEWRNHLIMTNDGYSNPMRVYYRAVATPEATTLGLPALASDPTVTPQAGALSYLYYFVYYYTYTILPGSVQFFNYGPTTQIQVTNSAEPAASPNHTAVTNIPALANGATGNYDTGNIKVKIYRTVQNGVIPYYLGEVTNGTTTYNDETPDASLDTTQVLYTYGGLVDHDPPPLAKYVVMANDIAWYLNVKEGSEEKSFRVRQAIQGAPNACPEDFYTDVDDNIVGGGVAKGVPIVFCDKAIYRLEGQRDLLGGGATRTRKISDYHGCTGHNSIVRTQKGLFFAGVDSFYFTDGFTVTKLDEDIDASYAVLVNSATKRKKIYGMRDPENARIIWAVSSQENGTENDSWYIFDEKKGAFTTASNEGYFEPTALGYFNDNIMRGNTYGHVFRHATNLFSDPKVDLTKPVADWVKTYIPIDLISSATDFGRFDVVKSVSDITICARNKSRIDLDISSRNDDVSEDIPLKTIRFTSSNPWGEPNLRWDDPSIVWGAGGMLYRKRLFPRSNWRCRHKQIRIRNAYAVIQNSDDTATATVDNTLKTATLGSSSWLTDVVDYYISFEDDNYTIQYLVVDRVSDTVITYEDIDDTSPTGTQKWLIKGYRKNAKLSLIGISISYAFIENKGAEFESGELGENA